VKPGMYSWLVTLWDESGAVDLWESVPEMLVATESFQHARDEWSGILNLPSRFSFLNHQESDLVATRFPGAAMK
jgi:hypothetical protein